MKDMSDSGISADEKTLYILLCNASFYLLQVYESLIRYVAHKYGYQTNFLVYENGKEAVFCKDDWMQEVDILVIGWEPGRMKGIEIARAFREDQCQAQILFLGNQTEDIIESYEVNPFYYFIENEVTHKKFELVMKKCFLEIVRNKKNSLQFISNGKIQRIQLELIVYLKVDHRMISITCRDKREILFYDSLKNIEEKIKDDTFMRTHRGYIVNLKYVDYLDKNELFLNTGESIPIARKYKQELVERMMDQEKNILI